MPIKDNKSNNSVLQVQSFILSPGNINFTEAIDTFNYDNGVTFFFSIFSTGDPANEVNLLSIQQSTDGIGNWENIPDGYYVGDITDMQNVTFAQVNGLVTGSVGVVSVDRYIRAQIEGPVGNVNDISGTVMCNLGLELKPGEK